MLQSTNALPVLESALSHPLSFSETDEKMRAQQLKDLLLSLAKDQQNNSFSSILRSAAESIRNKAFGYNRKVTKNKIIKLLQEFEKCEVIDFVEETDIKQNEIKAALLELIQEGKIGSTKRRRYQEPGKHYNDIYFLIK